MSHHTNHHHRSRTTPSTTTTLLTSALQHIGNRKKPYKSESQLVRSLTRLLGPKAHLAAVLAEWLWENYELVLPMLQRGVEFIEVAVRMVKKALEKRGVDVEGGIERVRSGLQRRGVDVDRHLDTLERGGLRRANTTAGNERTRGWVEELPDDAEEEAYYQPEIERRQSQQRGHRSDEEFDRSSRRMNTTRW